ncbi:MAG TPA: type II and III secretion system protein family protein [Rhizomicrobium sp.]|nr:type II and III secretion system protein family protein [Rhizomicrobium sp.]
MKKGLFAILAAGILAIAAMPAAARNVQATKVINVATQGGSAPQQHITLALDKAALVQLDADARDVLVSNPNVVDAVVRTPRRIFLLAQKVGQTNAFFFDNKGHQILTIDIRVERDVTDLAAMIHSYMPTSDIHVAALSDNVVLTGTVQNAGDSTRAQDLAGRFVGDPNKVANLLKIDSSQQVLLKVRVAEMQRSVAKQFGINAVGAFKVANVPVIAETSNPYGLGSALALASGAQVGSIGSDPLHPTPNNVQGVINALEQIGLVHTLAEPNLTAVSGETARFLAGGEFPVPVSRDQYGNVTVAFKQFGVGLSFTPVVMSPSNISLQISTEVSELSNAGAFTQAGGTSTTNTGSTTTVPSITIPALAVRRAQTTVEVPSGGSFAIAGLLQHTTKQTLDQFPGLGEMPVLGALFRSRDFQNDETELVVVATAYLVKPGKEKDYALPGEGYKAPNDLQTILFGRLSATYSNDPNGLKSAGPAKTGFIVE